MTTGPQDDWDDDQADDADYGGPVSCVPAAGGKPRVLAAQCGTCILRPGNLMHLRPGRLADLMASAAAEGCQGMICHDTLPGCAPDGYSPALCRGWYDAYGPRSNFVRVMSRLGGFTEIDPPGHTAGRPCIGEDQES